MSNNSNTEVQIQKRTPTALEPAPNFFGHIVKLNGAAKNVFCTRFYTVDGFLCMENVKCEESLYSDEELARMICSCCNYGVYQKRPCLKISTDRGYRELVQYYRLTAMRTMLSGKLEDSWALSTEDEAPDWTKKNQQEALAEANARVRKQNDEVRKKNREYLFKYTIPEYHKFVALKAYLKSRWRKLLFNKDTYRQKWIQEYIKNHEIDFSWLKEEIERCGIEFDPEIDWASLK